MDSLIVFDAVTKNAYKKPRKIHKIKVNNIGQSVK